MKDYYTLDELANQEWFPIKSRVTISKLIELGEISAMNIGSDGKNKYTIPRKAVGHYLTMNFKGKLASKLAISKKDIIDFLVKYDEKKGD